MDPGNPRGGGSSTSVVEDDEESRTDGLIPWLFTSIPSFNEATSYIAETTSYITSCFSESSGSYLPLDHSNNAQELVTFPFKQSLDTLDDSKPSSVASHSEFSEAISTATAAPALHGGLIRRSTFVSSSNDRLPEKEPHSNQNGATMFQSLIERAQRTIRGSAEDIGWLKHATGMPPVEDGTQRFFEILDRIRHGVHELPNSLVYLLIPGLFSNHGPLYFVNTKISFSKMGLVCHIAKIHSEASVEKNAREIKEYVEEIYWGSNKRVLLLGHSKGGVDAAAALSMYWPELKDKVAGLAFAQSPYGGSPIASDLMREGQLGDYVNFRKLMEILVCKVIKGDLQALEDLTYEKRKEFLRKHQLPRELPIVSFRTEAGVTPAVLDALNHVAHAELPVVTGTPTKLPVVMPLGAVMAACAQLLRLRYREKSDGLVTCCDAEVPGSVVVRPERKLDHAWMVYSTLNNDPLEADASQVCEALLLLLVEVGQKKRLVHALKDD